jgi:hypothetical protein
MSLQNLSTRELKTLMKNQEKCNNLSPVTTRATFKLSKLLELISLIVENCDLRPGDDETQHVCITFVRESGQNPLGLSGKPQKVTVKGKRFTQVIPIITGCVADWGKGKFRYLRVDVENPKTGKKLKRIPYVRPGGEGSGLIPPPPPDDDNFN